MQTHTHELLSFSPCHCPYTHTCTTGSLLTLYPAVKFSQLDIKRILVFSAWGGFGFTPIAMYWYNIIEATIPVAKNQKNRLIIVFIAAATC